MNSKQIIEKAEDWYIKEVNTYKLSVNGFIRRIIKLCEESHKKEIDDMTKQNLDSLDKLSKKEQELEDADKCIMCEDKKEPLVCVDCLDKHFKEVFLSDDAQKELQSNLKPFIEKAVEIGKQEERKAQQQRIDELIGKLQDVRYAESKDWVIKELKSLKGDKG